VIFLVPLLYDPEATVSWVIWSAKSVNVVSVLQEKAVIIPTQLTVKLRESPANNSCGIESSDT